MTVTELFDNSEVESVHNLQVEEYRTYFVVLAGAETAVLVHNNSNNSNPPLKALVPQMDYSAYKKGRVEVTGPNPNPGQAAQSAPDAGMGQMPMSPAGPLVVNPTNSQAVPLNIAGQSAAATTINGAVSSVENDQSMGWPHLLRASTEVNPIAVGIIRFRGGMYKLGGWGWALGERGFARELEDLYQKYPELSTVFKNGFRPHAEFKTIVRTLISLKSPEIHFDMIDRVDLWVAGRKVCPTCRNGIKAINSAIGREFINIIEIGRVGGASHVGVLFGLDDVFFLWNLLNGKAPRFQRGDIIEPTDPFFGFRIRHTYRRDMTPSGTRSVSSYPCAGKRRKMGTLHTR